MKVDGVKTAGGICFSHTSMSASVLTFLLQASKLFRAEYSEKGYKDEGVARFQKKQLHPFEVLKRTQYYTSDVVLKRKAQLAQIHYSNRERFREIIVNETLSLFNTLNTELSTLFKTKESAKYFTVISPFVNEVKSIILPILQKGSPIIHELYNRCDSEHSFDADNFFSSIMSLIDKVNGVFQERFSHYCICSQSFRDFFDLGCPEYSEAKNQYIENFNRAVCDTLASIQEMKKGYSIDL